MKDIPADIQSVVRELEQWILEKPHLTDIPKTMTNSSDQPKEQLRTKNILKKKKYIQQKISNYKFLGKKNTSTRNEDQQKIEEDIRRSKVSSVKSNSQSLATENLTLPADPANNFARTFQAKYLVGSDYIHSPQTSTSENLTAIAKYKCKHGPAVSPNQQQRPEQNPNIEKGEIPPLATERRKSPESTLMEKDTGQQK